LTKGGWGDFKEKKMSWKLAVVPEKKVEKFIDPLITS
jgi:hypothetical protein